MNIVVAIPAHNESLVLTDTIAALARACATYPAHQWHIVIAENGSTDGTWELAQRLAAAYPNVSAIRVAAPGKGGAIRAAWDSRVADAYCFMDADLATDLSALRPLTEAIHNGAAVVVGSRFHPRSRVTRSMARWVFAWGFRAVARVMVGRTVSDLPCGFKAVTATIKERIVPTVANNGWFFDTELMVRSLRAGVRVVEIPVTWHDRRGPADRSRVRTLRVAYEYIKNLWLIR